MAMVAILNFPTQAQFDFTPTAIDWNAIALPARCELARNLMEQGEYVAASHELESALAQGGDAFSLHAMMSTTYLLSGDIIRAKAHLAAAHQLDARNPDLLALEGQFELALGDPLKGENLLEQLVAMVPESFEARMILARSYLQREEPDLAQSHLQALLSLSHGAPATLVKVMLARSKSLKGEYDLALLLAQEAFQEEPSLPETIREWGLALLHRERYQEAKPYLERSWAQGPKDPQLAFAMGVLHFHLRNWESAETYWRRGNQMNPLAYPMAQKLVGLYLATGHVDKGQAIVDAMRSQSPHRVESLMLEAHWARKLGELAKAKHLLVRVDRLPLNHEMDSDLKWEKAQLEFEAGRHHNCQKWIQALVQDGAWVKEATLLESRIAFYQSKVAESQRLQALAKQLPVQWPKAGALIAGLSSKMPIGMASRMSQ
jgi:tetratricopeptide (TPR) repeat protein